MHGWINSSIWRKALLLPPDYYFTIVVACIVAFVPVAFQETISNISSLIKLKPWFQICLFLGFTITVINMGKRFIGFAIFAKYVFDRVQAQNLESEKSKEKFLSDEIFIKLEYKNKNAFGHIVAAIKWFSLASFLLLIMVAVK